VACVRCGVWYDGWCVWGRDLWEE